MDNVTTSVKSFLSSYAVWDGANVDTSATVAKFKAELEAYQAAQSGTLGKVRDAINKVFDTLGERRIAKPALISRVFEELGADITEYKTIGGQVNTIVKSAPDTFTTQVGVGGGIGRKASPVASDASVAAPEASSAEVVAAN